MLASCSSSNNKNNDNHDDDDVNFSDDSELVEASGKEFKAPRVQITTKTILVLLLPVLQVQRAAAASSAAEQQQWQQIARIKYVESMRHKG